jgi:hypothetical protein
MNFFDHKDLGNHLLQLWPKVVKHPVYGELKYKPVGRSRESREKSRESLQPDRVVRVRGSCEIVASGGGVRGRAAPS